MSSRSKFLAVSLLALSVAAGSAPASAQQVPEFWHYMGVGGEYDGVKAMIAEINKQNPDAPVTERVIPGHTQGLRQQVQVSLMGGTPPMAYQFNSGYDLTQVANSGRILDIEDVWQDIRGDEIFPEGLRRIITFDGVHTALPISLSIVNDVFYNKALFEKLNLTPPTTWEEWNTVCETLEANNVACLGNSAGWPWSFYNFYAPLLSVVGEEGYWQFARGELSWTGPEMREAFEIFRENYAEHYAPNWTAAAWADSSDQLMRGEIGMYQAGNWISGYMKGRGWTPGEDYDFFVAPGTEDQSIFQTDTVVVLKGDLQEQGKQFVRSVVSVEAQTAFNQPKGSLAPNVEVSTDIYDVIGKREAERFATMALPSLMILLPVDYRMAIGTEIEKYAANPTPEGLETSLAMLEQMRLSMADQKLFYAW
jgi:ABC-type glycerol-3-phosphate transport system substrate-binding protein